MMIRLIMKVVNCDYHKLTRDAVLLNDFEETIRQVNILYYSII